MTSPYRSEAERTCAHPRCGRPVSEGPEPGGTVSPDNDHCSWGCHAAHQVYAALRLAKMSTRAGDGQGR